VERFLISARDARITGRRSCCRVSFAAGGTGCHGMAIMLQDAGRGFEWITQMGGEGAPWNGIAPFADRKHIFQNLGDGTFLHSGMLSVQASVASGVNITYKLL